jgi:hypothetical protein
VSELFDVMMRRVEVEIWLCVMLRRADEVLREEKRCWKERGRGTGSDRGLEKDDGVAWSDHS